MAFTAIFGGTFNPFHIGHYEILKALENDERIEEIFVMPDKIPPHKVCDYLAEDNIRIEMCRIACEDFKKAKLCLVEFEREGKSYSYDTINHLKEIYPNKNFAFVCGGDMLVSFDKWYKYEEIMKLLPFIVFKRSDTNLEIFNKSVKKFKNIGMNIILKEEIIPLVSSTGIRSDFENNKDLLPTKIYNFLNEREVYNG